MRAVLIKDKRSPKLGSSFVLVQRWMHDLPAFSQLSESQQENVFGRTKLDSKKLKAPPEDSHLPQVEPKDTKQDYKLVRQSLPFIGTNEQGLIYCMRWMLTGTVGLVFIAYGSREEKFEFLLRRMMGLEAPFKVGSLLSFSKCLSSSLFFVPSLSQLAVIHPISKL